MGPGRALRANPRRRHRGQRFPWASQAGRLSRWSPGRVCRTKGTKRLRAAVLTATGCSGPRAPASLRARLEVTLGTELVVRRGDQVVRMPVVSILERPQHTPDQSPLTLSVDRLPWDSLAIEMGQGAEEGVVSPSASVPLRVQYNILWPEATEVNVRTTAVLRPLGSTEVLWKSEERELVPANRLDPPPRLWKVPAPAAEGTFVLEVRANWEPSSARDTSRLGRLIRRRKPAPVCSAASRRVLFSVVSPHEQATFPARPGAAEMAGRETEVDSVDLTRIRSTRFSAWGRRRS